MGRRTISVCGRGGLGNLKKQRRRMIHGARSCCFVYDRADGILRKWVLVSSVCVEEKRNALLYTFIPLLSYPCLFGSIILFKKLGPTTLSPLSPTLLVQIDKGGMRVG